MVERFSIDFDLVSYTYHYRYQITTSLIWTNTFFSGSVIITILRLQHQQCQIWLSMNFSIRMMVNRRQLEKSKTRVKDHCYVITMALIKAMFTTKSYNWLGFIHYHLVIFCEKQNPSLSVLVVSKPVDTWCTCYGSCLNKCFHVISNFKDI